MKKTFKSILVIALVALSMNVNAQGIGIEAGYSNSTSIYNDDKQDGVNGFHVLDLLQN